MALHAQQKKYGMHEQDIPVWGKPIIFNTPEEAEASLNDDPTGSQYVRLIRVADNKQLAALLLQGKELLKSKTANLYLRVADTCPAYYAQWESTRENTHHEVVNKLKRGAPRDSMLKVWVDGEGRVQSPLALCVYRSIRDTAGEVVLVHPGTSVVCRQEDLLLGVEGSLGVEEEKAGEEGGSGEADATSVATDA